MHCLSLEKPLRELQFTSKQVLYTMKFLPKFNNLEINKAIWEKKKSKPTTKQKQTYQPFINVQHFGHLE